MTVSNGICADEQSLENLSDAEKIRLGERMYRDGVLPSGEPIQAFVAGDVPVEGATFTCVSCHLRSGLGSLEGGVATPPTNGRLLYQKREPFVPGYEFVPSFHSYSADYPVRPAYTDESLAALITSGVDSNGRSVLEAMPRYEIDDAEMELLIFYLKQLSDEPSPGISKDAIKFATVIVDGVDPMKVKSMLTPIEYGIQRKNALATASAANDRVARMGYNMLGPDLMMKRFSLAQWVLKGPSSTWREQLENYYKAEPVFALLGGISDGDWEPVHRFCEDYRLPNLLPVVDYPVISDEDWYTMYFSRGVRQEGESAARYLNGMAELIAKRSLVQIVRDSRKAKALAEGFREIWKSVGQSAVTEVLLKEDEPLTASRLQQILNEYKPAVVMLWDGPESLAAFEGIEKTANKPSLVFASGTYFDEALWTVPKELRDLFYFTYPYRLPKEDARYDYSVRRVLMGKPPQEYDQKIVRKSYTTNELLGKALVDMRGEYYRDFFFDVIGMMTDAYYPLYERVGFGPGQRYISKGCFIVQLSQDETPVLERRSEWATQ